MAKPRSPPYQRVTVTPDPPKIIELDRFDAKSVDAWKELSVKLDQLVDTLFYATEPHRLRYRTALISALQKRPAKPLSFEKWTRFVTYRYSLEPLSAAGSLTGYGGRFNIGQNVGKAGRYWPALYIGEDQETAYREYYQLPNEGSHGGLSAADLALDARKSVSSILLSGHMENVFDVGDERALAPVCKVLSRIDLPKDIKPLSKALNLRKGVVSMIKTPAQMKKALLVHNWRIAPVQFDLPAPSQILAELIYAAGYEAIRYPSTKSGGICLAVFPSNLGSDKSFVSLADSAPEGVDITRLDLATADFLCGQELIKKL